MTPVILLFAIKLLARLNIFNQCYVSLNDFKCRKILIFFADKMRGSNQYQKVKVKFGMVFRLTYGLSAGRQRFSINNQILV